MLIFVLIIHSILFMSLLIFGFCLLFQYKKEKSNYLKQKFDNINKEISKSEQELTLSNIKIEKEKLEYSKQLNTFIKEYAAQIVIIKFNTFKDTHKVESSTKQQYEKIIGEAAREVKKSINLNNISLLSNEAIDKMIIDNIIMYIKKLIDENNENDTQLII